MLWPSRQRATELNQVGEETEMMTCSRLGEGKSLMLVLRIRSEVQQVQFVVSSEIRACGVQLGAPWRAGRLRPTTKTVLGRKSKVAPWGKHTD